MSKIVMLQLGNTGLQSLDPFDDLARRIELARSAPLLSVVVMWEVDVDADS